MIGSTAWAVVAAVACLGAGVTCLALAAAGVGERGAQLTHGVMGVAMAGMFSPWGNPVPGWIGAVGFTVLGAWFVAAGLSRARRGRSVHHLAVSSVAMVLMYLMHHHATGTSGPAGAGAHARHLAESGSTASLVAMPLALVLAGYFVWHTWTCVERSRTARATGTAPTTVRTVGRIESVTHGVMSALMAAMFLSAV